MKVIKRPEPKALAKIADDLGQKYIDTSAAAKEADGAKGAASDAVKEAAAMYGADTADGKKRLIAGNKYVVGFTYTSGLVLDLDKAKRMLTNEQYNSCLEKVFSESRLAELVQTGKISAKTAEALYSVKKGSPRIYVTEKTDEGNAA